ncbi:MAG: sigma-70 family RNA polymerase sigma factor [Nocardioides sp.]|uniref:sigma-70 family RNA polymerase sigma factor n=1 Tax=Nocardioides sp. TaxID=35761 RepID=UPI003267AFD0
MTHPESERRRRTRELFEQTTQPSNEWRRSEILDAIVVLNVPMARSIAGRYRQRGCDLEDLEQTAYLALVRAVRRFDTTRCQDFLCFAVPSIRGEVKRYFRDFGWMVRPPRSVQDLQPLVKWEISRYADLTGRAPDADQIAEVLGVPTAAVNAAMQAQGCFSVVSLDRGVGVGEETTLAELLVHPDGSDSAFAAAEARAMLAVGLVRLTPRDRAVIHLRFVEELSQSDIATALGVSQPLVSRVLHRALEQLHEFLAEPSTAYSKSA